jgi:hypothetical protein
MQAMTEHPPEVNESFTQQTTLPNESAEIMAAQLCVILIIMKLYTQNG